jgi:hypothetical protein
MDNTKNKYYTLNNRASPLKSPALDPSFSPEGQEGLPASFYSPLEQQLEFIPELFSKPPAPVGIEDAQRHSQALPQRQSERIVVTIASEQTPFQSHNAQSQMRLGRRILPRTGQQRLVRNRRHWLINSILSLSRRK